MLPVTYNKKSKKKFKKKLIFVSVSFLLMRHYCQLGQSTYSNTLVISKYCSLKVNLEGLLWLQGKLCTGIRLECQFGMGSDYKRVFDFEDDLQVLLNWK